MKSPLKFLKSAFDIRAQEFRRVFLMSAYLFLIIACYTTTKAVRDSLFVTHIGPLQLPYVYLLIAGVMGVVSLVYSRLIVRVGLYSLIRITSLFAIANLIFFWWVLSRDPDGWFYILYVWVSVFGAITASEAWLLATHVFDAREARRLYAWVGAGGILGGILGGSVTRIIAPRLGTEALLPFCAGMMLLTIIILYGLSGPKRAQDESAGAEQNGNDKEGISGFRLVRQSPHLCLIVLILGLGVVVEAFVDYEFKTVASGAFRSKDQLTAFLGVMASYIGLLSLLFQLFFTSTILKRFGVGTGIMLLPIGLLSAFALLAAKPSLFAAAALQVIDGALSYSIHRSSTELLYLPIQSDVRNKVKGFIDTFVDRFGRAIGGLVLLVFTAVLPASIPALSVIAGIFVLAWIGAAFSVKRFYLQSFRQALEKKTIEPEALFTRDLDKATIRPVLDALSSSDERQVLYALDLLGGTHPTHWRRHLSTLLQHDSAAVRVQTIAALAKWDDRTMMPAILKCLQDPDLSVRAEAIHYLHRTDPRPPARLMEFLNHKDYAIVHAAVHCMAKYQIDGKNRIDKRLVEGALNASGGRGVGARVAAASALNLVWTGSSIVRRHLDRLLADSSPDVARQAIQTTANVKYEGAIPALIDKLADSRLRREARDALVKFDEDVIPELERRLLDHGEPEAIRARIPKVLAYMGRQEAADILLASFKHMPPNMELPVLKALNAMRLEFPTVEFPREVVLDLVQRERDEYRQLQNIFNWLRMNASEPAVQPGLSSSAGAVLLLLVRTIGERLERKLEAVFRLLALSHLPHDIYSAYHIFVTKPDLRSQALEFLDNLMDADFKALVIPLVEEPSDAIDQAEDDPEKRLTLHGLLRILRRGDDPWLQTIAGDLASRLRSEHRQRAYTT